jgi:hypothetical protein
VIRPVFESDTSPKRSRLNHRRMSSQHKMSLLSTVLLDEICALLGYYAPSYGNYHRGGSLKSKSYLISCFQTFACHDVKTEKIVFKITGEHISIVLGMSVRAD